MFFAVKGAYDPDSCKVFTQDKVQLVYLFLDLTENRHYKFSYDKYNNCYNRQRFKQKDCQLFVF